MYGYRYTLYIKQSIVHILGIRINVVTKQQALAMLHDFLYEPMFHLVATPNNEIILKAQQNVKFKTVLNAAALNIPDSTGLLLAAQFTGQHLPSRVTGVDTMTTFCSELDSSTPIFLLGATEGVAAKAASALEARNPQLNVAGTFSGSPHADEAEDICSRITASGAKVLFVAYGAPKQELWLHHNADKLPNIRIGMGVGGSFDFLAGTVHRAPKIMQALGIEWLWRLIQEPSRLPRIWSATVIFIWYVLRYGKYGQ